MTTTIGTVALNLDHSRLDDQIATLNALLPEGGSKLSDGELTGLLDDLIVADPVSTVGADGAPCLVVTVRFGEGFDTFVAALRADKFHGDPL